MTLSTSNLYNLKNKNALVLASSQGLGFAIAKLLIESGANTIIHSRGGRRLEEAADALKCPFASWDLTQLGATRRGVRMVQDTYGPIDILVTNSGGPKSGAILELSDDDWRTGAQALLFSVIECVSVVAPQMSGRGNGRIILNLSVAAKETVPNLALSNIYRSALLGLTKDLSAEMAPSGTTVNAILPGFIETARLAAFGNQVDSIRNSIPMNRFGSPNDIAQLAIFLASDVSQYITGCAIPCDGGYLKSI